jgi:site-specific recombinase XerD
MLMVKELGVSREYTTEEEWLEDIFYRSNSYGSKTNAQFALRAFDMFCKEKLGIEDPDIEELENEFKKKHNITKKSQMVNNPKWTKYRKDFLAKFYQEARLQIAEQYQTWYNQNPQDILSICTSLQKWVRFCSQDHPEVKLYPNRTWTSKKPATILQYFSHIKDYLRKCHGVRITSDDVRAYIKFPKQMKVQREPLELEDIKKLLEFADPQRRALYYTLLSSAMRLGEGLSLKKHSFNIDVRPIEIHLRAQDTKTGEARTCYISEEAWEKVAPIYNATNDGEYLFNKENRRKDRAVQHEDRYFIRLREKIAKKFGDKAPCDQFPDGTGMLRRYEDSSRYCIQIHAFRSWFMTKAMKVHDKDYADAISGHHSYLDQYIRIPKKEQQKMYLEVEKAIQIETSRVHSEQFHEAEIAQMQEEIAKLKAMAERKEEPEYHKESRDGLGVTS